MAGGNYHNQLYKDYEEAVQLNEELLALLKKQTAQHKKDAEYMKQLEKTIAKQKEKLDALLEEKAALEKEVLRLNGLAKTDSTNSGMPTSQTPLQKKKHIPNTRKKSGKKKGGQLGHQKAVLPKFEEEEINAQEVHEMTDCPHCQGVLQEMGAMRTKNELDYEVVIIKKRHYFPEYQCTHCHKKVHSAVPKELKEENQYGGHVQSLALSLMNEANVSINKTKKMIEGLTFDVIRPSEGYLAKLQKRAAKKLEGFAENLRHHLLKQPLIYWDDTVIDINTNRSCLRFYGTEQLALYKAHPRKDLAGIQSDNLLALLPPETTVMHDHNKVNYNALFSYDNVECNVHLLRDLRKCTENIGHIWSKQLDELITSTNVKRQYFIEQESGTFSPVEEFSFFTALDRLIFNQPYTVDALTHE